MALSEQSYPTTASSGYPNTTKERENDLKSNLIEMTDAFKEEMNKSLGEIHKNTIKRVKEMTGLASVLRCFRKEVMSRPHTHLPLEGEWEEPVISKSLPWPTG